MSRAKPRQAARRNSRLANPAQQCSSKGGRKAAFVVSQPPCDAVFARFAIAGLAAAAIHRSSDTSSDGSPIIIKVLPAIGGGLCLFLAREYNASLGNPAIVRRDVADLPGITDRLAPDDSLSGFRLMD